MTDERCKWCNRRGMPLRRRGLEPTAVPSDADVTVTITASLRHHCPFVDETDDGDVEISWRCNGQTLELHALRAWLDQWAVCENSHEEITDIIAHAITGIVGIEDVKVTSHWTTAGMAVTVGGGSDSIPRQSLHAEGA